MIDAFAGALSGQLVMLAQEGRQLQRLQVMRQQDCGVPSEASVMAPPQRADPGSCGPR